MTVPLYSSLKKNLKLVCFTLFISFSISGYSLYFSNTPDARLSDLEYKVNSLNYKINDLETEVSNLKSKLRYNNIY
jgi:cell division protein FtsL